MKQGRTIIGAGSAELDKASAGADAAEEGDEAAADAAASELRPWRVTSDQHAARLDLVLAQAAPEFSRSYLQQLVTGGAVTVNGRRAERPAHRVKAGDLLEVELRPTPQSLAFQPEPMPLVVVYEDEHLLVIDKPPGLVVHPAPGHWKGTLLNGLLARDKAAATLPRAGIVHRLDKDTSGLMVVARTRVCMEALVRLIAAREVTRQYVALAHGAWLGEGPRMVDGPIGRDPRNRLRMAVVDLERHPGKPATTIFELLAGAPQGCLVQASLLTGRTHQIRVHMAHIGHPLVADEVYGGPPAAGLLRQALHAFRLAFTHPVTGEALDLRAPLPDDLVHGLSEWGLRYNPPPVPSRAARPPGPSAPAGQRPPSEAAAPPTGST